MSIQGSATHHYCACIKTYRSLFKKRFYASLLNCSVSNSYWKWTKTLPWHLRTTKGVSHLHPRTPSALPPLPGLETCQLCTWVILPSVPTEMPSEDCSLTLCPKLLFKIIFKIIFVLYKTILKSITYKVLIVIFIKT